MKIKKYRFNGKALYPFLDINSSGEIFLQMTELPLEVNSSYPHSIWATYCYGLRCLGRWK